MTSPTTQADIQEFLDQNQFAVIGVSINPKHFARYVFQTLKGKGYNVYPVNPFAERIGDERCYPTVHSLPEKVDGAIILLPSNKVLTVLQDISDAQVARVWIQQHSETPEAIQFCLDHKITVITGQCVLMFAEPIRGAHQFHRWIRKVTGSLPN